MARFLLVIFSLINLMSCTDIFSTRDPEPPDGNSDNFLNESAAELILNFKTSLFNLDTQLYESAFINFPDSPYEYKFVCQASDIPHPEIFMDWNIENEKKFISGIKASAFYFSAIELSHDPINEAADSLLMTVTYEMDLNTGESMKTLKGNFIFDLVKYQGNFWYIKTWTDISASGNNSFSALKADHGL
jgi:hypothetical protein